MQPQPEFKIDYSEIQQWISDQLTVKKAEALLVAKGFDADTVSLYLKEFRKQLYARRRTKGFLFAVLGAIIGFIGCMIAILNPFPALYTVALFGFTSVAAIFICAGLYFLFE